MHSIAMPSGSIRYTDGQPVRHADDNADDGTELANRGED